MNKKLEAERIMNDDFKKFFKTLLEELIPKVAAEIVYVWNSDLELTEKEKNLVMKRITEKMHEKIPQIIENLVGELKKREMSRLEDLEGKEEFLKKLIANAVIESFSKEVST